MKIVFIFTITAVVLTLLLVLIWILGWSLDPKILDRLSRPEDSYAVIQDESYRTNELIETKTVLTIYSDDAVALDSNATKLRVNPAILDGSVNLALARAKWLGITNLLFVNRENCAEPFFGEIRLTLGYFVKRISYSQCQAQTNSSVQIYHKYLFDTFTIKESD